MNVAVLVSIADTVSAIESSIRSQGGHVSVFDVKRAPTIDELDAFRPDVVFCGESMKVVAAVRRLKLRNRPYIIAVLPKTSGKLISRASFAGADDAMLWTASSEEIVFRADAVNRLMQWAPSQHRTRAQNLLAWEDAENVFGRVLTEDFGRYFASDNALPRDVSTAASVELTQTDTGAIVHLTIGIARESLDAFTRLACDGLEGEELRNDALRELANLAGGTFKRLSLEEGTTFVLGLPRDVPPDTLERADKRWHARADDLHLYFGLTMSSGNGRRLRTVDLRPGMVLKNDIRNTAGIPFVRSGCTLTERTIQRVIDFCGQDTSVDVWTSEAA